MAKTKKQKFGEETNLGEGEQEIEVPAEAVAEMQKSGLKNQALAEAFFSDLKE